MKFCGKCGTELKDDAKFCSNCGEPCYNMPRAGAVKESKRKSWVPLIGGAFVLLVALVVAFTIFRRNNSLDQQSDNGDVYDAIETFTVDSPQQKEIMHEIPTAPLGIPLAEQIRISNNNNLNDVYFATDGEYLYCSSEVLDYSGTPRILRIRLEDFTIETEYETTWMNFDVKEPFTPANLLLIDGQLYFQDSRYDTLYTIDFETGELQQLTFTNSSACFQTDGKSFYASGYPFSFDDFGIYKGEISTVLNTARQEDAFTQIADIAVKSLFLHGEYLYAKGKSLTWDDVEINNSGLWRMDLDGSNLIKVFDSSPGYLLFSEDKLFYTYSDSSAGYRLYSANLDGSDEYLYESIRIDDMGGYSVNICNEYIFYEHLIDNTIHRVNMDGTNDIQITTCESTNISIIGDWLVYFNEEDCNYYKTTFDGSTNCLLLDPVAET